MSANRSSPLCYVVLRHALRYTTFWPRAALTAVSRSEGPDRHTQLVDDVMRCFNTFPNGTAQAGKTVCFEKFAAVMSSQVL